MDNRTRLFFIDKQIITTNWFRQIKKFRNTAVFKFYVHLTLVSQLTPCNIKVEMIFTKKYVYREAISSDLIDTWRWSVFVACYRIQIPMVINHFSQTWAFSARIPKFNRNSHRILIWRPVILVQPADAQVWFKWTEFWLIGCKIQGGRCSPDS